MPREVAISRLTTSSNPFLMFKSTFYFKTNVNKKSSGCLCLFRVTLIMQINKIITFIHESLGKKTQQGTQ